MKLISIFLLFMITAGTCDSNSQSKEITQIQYLASTRGSTVHIIISPEALAYNDTTVELSAKQWESLTAEVNTISLEELSTLEAPSQDRFRDAALSAELTIVTTAETYSSPAFDHGNPPKEIAELIDLIFELAGIE